MTIVIASRNPMSPLRSDLIRTRSQREVIKGDACGQYYSHAALVESASHGSAAHLYQLLPELVAGPDAHLPDGLDQCRGTLPQVQSNGDRSGTAELRETVQQVEVHRVQDVGVAPLVLVHGEDRLLLVLKGPGLHSGIAGVHELGPSEGHDLASAGVVGYEVRDLVAGQLH